MNQSVISFTNTHIGLFTSARPSTEMLTQDLGTQKVSLSHQPSFGYQENPILFSRRGRVFHSSQSMRMLVRVLLVLKIASYMYIYIYLWSISLSANCQTFIQIYQKNVKLILQKNLKLILQIWSNFPKKYSNAYISGAFWYKSTPGAWP